MEQFLSVILQFQECRNFIVQMIVQLYSCTLYNVQRTVRCTVYGNSKIAAPAAT